MKMSTLGNKTQNILISSRLEVAENFFARGLGLMGRRNFSMDQGLWIHRCKSIHTCFMKFAIDCVFVDANLKVKSLKKEIKPWRLVLPIWGADSVFELPSGTITRLKIQEGDELYVGH
ncbi:MAG: DUF192 domain-containing protein [Bdellovibrionota bacterium]